MPSFTQPATYVTVDIAPRPVPSSSISYMSAVLKERLLDFLTYPHMYSDLLATQADAFFENLKDNLYTDPEKLRKSTREEWCLLTPATITEDRTATLSPALNVQNSAAPLPLSQAHWIPIQAGAVPSSSCSIINRSFVIAVCKSTRSQSFRAGDAILTWFISVLPLLRNDFDALGAVAKGLRGVTEEERPMFSEVPGDPVVIQLNIWKPAGFEYSAVSPL